MGMFLLFLSCVDEQDFDQVNDLTITPTVATGIFYLESDQNTIDNTSSNNVFYSQTIDFEAFNEPYVAERLLEGVLLYEVENTTNKILQLTIEFLDVNGLVLDTEIFNIAAYPSGTFDREVAYPADKSLAILTNTTDIRLTGLLIGEDTNSMEPADPKIKLRSAGEFLFQLQ
ncbi:hypothetical protein Musp01_14510 [Muricauda sp. NBRC 101325]|nr:hypothetical protein Musp01_14510 [Muricauda sp. NBRC 101325]